MSAQRFIVTCLLQVLLGCGSTARESREGPGETVVPCSAETAESARLLIDDFEDGDALLHVGQRLRGFWYLNNDGTGSQLPPVASGGATPELIANEGAPDSSAHALYTSGGGFERWGAFVAARLNSAQGRACSIDVSSSEGIELNVKGSGSMRVNVGIVGTTPVEDGGDCHGDACSDFGALVSLDDEWQRVQLPFEALSQPAWAMPADWDPARTLRVSFWSDGTDFEFWIDDVSFY